nr:unnamed protein product [Callosobruchus chinensis]
MAEFSERQKRKTNIILFNVPEPNQSSTVEHQRESDKSAVSDILSTIVPDLSFGNTKPIGLGPYGHSKVRPIKAVFENADTVRKILANAKKLKSVAAYKTIVIASDRTKKQIEYYKQVKQELINRQSAGDTNCRIKYINGVPKIMSLN